MIKWKVDENKELPVAVIEDAEEGYGVCELDGGGIASREELEKTAGLIAAAPEMRDVLRKVQTAIANWRDDEPMELCLEEIKYCLVDPVLERIDNK